MKSSPTFTIVHSANATKRSKPLILQVFTAEVAKKPIGRPPGRPPGKSKVTKK